MRDSAPCRGRQAPEGEGERREFRQCPRPQERPLRPAHPQFRVRRQRRVHLEHPECLAHPEEADEACSAGNPR